MDYQEEARELYNMVRFSSSDVQAQAVALLAAKLELAHMEGKRGQIEAHLNRLREAQP